jgi:hypothetical protein
MSLRPALLLPLLLLAACSKEPAPPTDAPEATPAASAPADDATAADVPAPAEPASAAGPEATGTPPADDELAALVTAADTLATLRERHGDANVVEAALPAGEGTEEPGWKLFPDNPDPVHVFLGESGHPTYLIVYGPRSGWGAHGVRLGMTLPELQALNGGPLAVSGFGWDYGGRVVDWRGGKLADLGITADLCPPQDVEMPEEWPLGEEPFGSDDPRVAAVAPVICSLGQHL